MAERKRTPEICPVCGEDVPLKALACPACGADHNSGWREDALDYDGVDVEEEPFDYDEFVQKEFGGGSRKSQVPLVWAVTAILLLVAMALFLLLR